MFKKMASDTQTNKLVRKPSAFLYLAAASALLGAIDMGMVIGWTSPALEDMQRDDSEPKLTNSTEDKDTKSWIGSSMTLGALVGALSSGPIAQLFGRKLAIISFGIPMTIGWFLIFIAKSVPLIMIGRIITGASVGLICGTVPIYVVEISTDNVRGLLGTCFQVCVTIGILVVFVFGSFLTFNWLAFVSLIPGLLMSAAMVLMPETPIWLLTKSKASKAEKALSRLRDRSNDNESEFNELTEQANQSNRTNQISIKQAKNPQVYEPFALALGLMFFQQFSGINAVMFYATSIFKDSGSSLKPSTATIIVGLAQVIATIVGSLLVDRLGRKILLTTSGSGHAISLGIMGIYYYQTKNISPEENSWGWLPLICLVIFIISFSVGWGPIPWLMIPEMTPISARSMISAVATALNWMCAFIVSKNFQWLQTIISKEGAFFLFAAFCLISVLFVVFLLPETKGKPLEQIVTNFSNKTSSAQNTSSDPILETTQRNEGGVHESNKTTEMHESSNKA